MTSVNIYSVLLSHHRNYTNDHLSESVHKVILSIKTQHVDGLVRDSQGWVNSIPELELQLNSNSNSGIEIEIDGIENGIGIENPGIGIGI